jgi:hypothetical protein
VEALNFTAILKHSDLNFRSANQGPKDGNVGNTRPTLQWYNFDSSTDQK